MERLLAEWDELARDGTHPDDEVVQRAWRRGTVGKLVRQHTAIRLATRSDVVGGLRDAGQDRMADVLAKHVVEVRGAIDRLDEHSRGMSAWTSLLDDFDSAVSDLRSLWRSEFPRGQRVQPGSRPLRPGPGALPTPQRPIMWRSTPSSIRPSVATGITGLPRSCASIRSMTCCAASPPPRAPCSPTLNWRNSSMPASRSSSATQLSVPAGRGPVVRPRRRPVREAAPRTMGSCPSRSTRCSGTAVA